MTETLGSVSPPEDVAVSPPNAAQDHDPEVEGSAQPSVEELEIARELVRTARARGVALTGPDGMLKALTKTVIETALDEEMSEHLGYDKHEIAGRNSGNSRNGVRTKTVLTDNVGPIEITVPRDRDGTFSPVIVAKRQRRLGDVDTIVLSPYPAISGLWRSAWEQFTPFLDYDAEIRKVLCSTNAIESLNARYRRAVSVRGHFPTEQAAMKCLYMVTRSLDPRAPVRHDGR